MIFAIDFDGTVVDHRYPSVGEDNPYAVETLLILTSKGHKLVLNTMRSGKELEDAVEWFNEKNIPLYGINHNPDQDEWTTSPKVYANIYIDDAALGCPLLQLARFKRPCVDWEKVSQILKHQNFI